MLAGKYTTGEMILLMAPLENELGRAVTSAALMYAHHSMINLFMLLQIVYEKIMLLDLQHQLEKKMASALMA